MGESEVASYYESYWSAAGYHPEGSLSSGLAALFTRYLPAAGRCLDVGCGTGAGPGQWVTAHGIVYQGVDVSDNAIREAQALGLNATTISDSAQLPFEDNAFDAALCIEVLEHLFLPLRTLIEIRRVLKPGGVLIATTPNVAYWRRRVDLALLGRWNPFGDNLGVPEPWRDPHIRFFNPKALKRCMAKAGFVGIVIGAHEGGFLSDLPRLRQHFSGPSPTYRFLMHRVPSLFGLRLHGIGHKPSPGTAHKPAEPD